MGVLCCYFRPNMLSPGDRVHYHNVRVMQAEHVQPFKVCYSRTQKFFTVPLLAPGKGLPKCAANTT